MLYGNRNMDKDGDAFGHVDVSRPFGYGEWQQAKEALLAAYPELEYVKLGTSVLGREIGAVRLGNGKRQLYCHAAMHANEWITGMAAATFLEEGARAWRENRTWLGRPVRPLLEKVSLWVTPLVNPDGVELVLKGPVSAGPYAREVEAWNGNGEDFSGWKANIRGVDLNDQFPAHWEEERQRRAVDAPGPRDYTGEAPLTEPEAQAVYAFTLELKPQLTLALHSQGREIYWNYRDLEPPGAEAAARRLAEVAGYQAIKLEGSDAGYKDWYIAEFRSLGFTIEVGYGQNPLPLEQFADIYREVSLILLEACQIASEW